MHIVRYQGSSKQAWDEFVKKSKTGYFFFYRDYMEYHKDRFHDHSLVVLNQKNRIEALLPANVRENTMYSHQGLTFGGFLLGMKTTTARMLEICDLTLEYLRKNEFTSLIYKCMPHIYHAIPAEEDRYALFRNNASLIRRDVSSSIFMKCRPKYRHGRSQSIKNATRNGLYVEQNKDFDAYWSILTDTLERRYGTTPTHTLGDIVRLEKMFPHNIKLFVAKVRDRILAGTVVFENEEVAHTQYLANSEEGRRAGALDMVVDHLLNDVYSNKRWFDFGISNEENGSYLNSGLIEHKEGFGARAVVHDFYELRL